MAIATIPRWKTDWTKCCLCQEDRDEKLTCPTRYGIEQSGYILVGKNVPMFQSINEMPIKFDSALLDEGSGIEETLRANNAKYHQSCKRLFSNQKLEQAKINSRKRSTNYWYRRRKHFKSQKS